MRRGVRERSEGGVLVEIMVLIIPSIAPDLSVLDQLMVVAALSPWPGAGSFAVETPITDSRLAPPPNSQLPWRKMVKR